jgi:sn-glycerol 3-phosphate transport system permease protein
MVERRPVLTFFTHAILLVGVAIVAFPVYLTFVASTHTAEEIVQAPMPLLPGDQFWHNYTAAFTGSEKGPGSGAPVGRMMWMSMV